MTILFVLLAASLILFILGFAWIMVLRGHTTRRSGAEVGVEYLEEEMARRDLRAGKGSLGRKAWFWGKGWAVEREAAFSYKELKNMWREGSYGAVLPMALVIVGMMSSIILGGVVLLLGLGNPIPGLFVIGEANFSDHGANRLGASALMQGLADGFFVIPNTLGQYIAKGKLPDVDPTCDEVREVEQGVKDFNQKLLEVNGSKTVDYFHRAMGMIMLDKCGMSRSKEGLDEAIAKIKAGGLEGLSHANDQWAPQINLGMPVLIPES